MKFELSKAIEEINKNAYNLVAIQVPDGLKPKAPSIAKKIEEQTNCKVILWGGSCFGACDIPLQLKRLGVKVLIQIGHGRMNY